MRILHTGDTHIGYRQYGSDERRTDFLDAFEKVVDDAVEDEVSAFVHAGDLFHSRNPGLDDIIATIDTFKKLEKNGIPALAVVGNHEGKRSSQWLDLLESLGLVTRLRKSPEIIDDVAFYGVDYVPPSRIDSFEYEFEKVESSANILVSHGRFKPFPYGEWDLESFVDKADIEWDAFLLGDYHHYEKEKIDGVWATYCGSTERASAEEVENRGYNLIEVENGNVSVTRRSIRTREFVFVDVDLTGAEIEERSATQYVIERVREHDVEGKVVIVDIDGDTDENVVQSEIEEVTNDRGALVTRVKDRRETETETEETDVNFTDPDDAVREKVNRMGLSEAGRELDSMIRESKIADSNIADEAQTRIDKLIEESTENFERKEPIDDEKNGSRIEENDSGIGENETKDRRKAKDRRTEKDETKGGEVQNGEQNRGQDGETEETETEDGEQKPGEKKMKSKLTDKEEENSEIETSQDSNSEIETSQDSNSEIETSQDGREDESEKDGGKDEKSGQSSMEDWV